MFSEFSAAVHSQFNSMSIGDLFVVDLDKDKIWETYLSSFPKGSNEIYKTNTIHDCNCCKSFVRRLGGVVSIKNGVLSSIWDIEDSIQDGVYKTVAKELSNLVKSSKIKTRFLSDEHTVGAEYTHQLLDDGTAHIWNHFYASIISKHFSSDKASKLSEINAAFQVFSSGLNKISTESIDIVVDLIFQGSIYRGDEFKDSTLEFLKLKREYDSLTSDRSKELYIWENVGNPVSRIKNSVIGTLFEDITANIDLTKAVASFESKVAPANYKRTSAPISQGMIKKAMEFIESEGLEPSLYRRFARPTDMNVNDVLFVDRSISPVMKNSLTNLLMSEVKQPSKTFENIDEISIEDFINDILPKTTSIEAFVSNNIKSNFVSIIAPQHEDSKNILKWDNNFSWVYAGNVTDSLKENVKAAGGNVDGVLRFSIQWNDTMESQDDLDAFCIEPNGRRIYFGNLSSPSSGCLDIDVRVPKGVANENIIYTNLSRMPEGKYHFGVNNYSHRGGKGFTAQVEYSGKILNFTYDKKLNQDENVVVADVFLKNSQFSHTSTLEHKEMSSEIWGIKTEKFVKVSSVMLSPNFWGESKEGNKHYIFTLENCVNPTTPIGIYNEFLNNSLTEFRKVMEVLAGKMKCESSEDQLSGIGFSSTTRNELIVKVSGNFTRTLRIKF